MVIYYWFTLFIRTSGQLGSKKRAKKFQSELRHLKMILGNELDTNLKVKGLSLRYITSNSQRDFVTRLINGEGKVKIPLVFILVIFPR